MCPEYEAYSHEIESLNLKYGNRIKRGIEIITSLEMLIF